MDHNPKVWVYGRSSGDEKDTGQDVKEQVAALRHEAESRGWTVMGSSFDEGVSGDTEPTEREGFQAAMKAVKADLAELVIISEGNRFSRQHPIQAMLAWDQVKASGVPVVSVKEAHFDGRRDDEGDKELLLVRFISFYTSWGERITIKERTALAMREIHAGRRKTKTGRPPGRPCKLTKEQAERAWMWAQETTPAEAARRLSRENGAEKALDDRTRRKRRIARTTLISAWERYKIGVEKPEVAEKNTDTETRGCVPSGSVPDTRGSGA